ncbi:MAG: glutaminyl-peptide cyclotransferase [Cyclobacteriaceae bacterium]|nr:glutaminyl-peptide cyclotransferase [Cyclobacteriaceae bacterium]
MKRFLSNLIRNPAYRENNSKAFHPLGAALLAVFVLQSCSVEKENKRLVSDTLTIAYTVRDAWPHDTQSFTQGLLIHQGKLYESTGEKNSWIGIVDIATGKPDKKVTLDKKYFGEGITILNNKVYQLTWKNNTGFIYDLYSFTKLGEFPLSFAKEGWGLTNNDEHLIMSDGTEKIYYLDTLSLKPVKTLRIRDERGYATNLNELEYVNGFIFANIWQTNTIVKIDPGTSRVVGRLDLTSLAEKAEKINPSIDVMNGIAWHPGTESFLVTGKYWPVIYVLKLQEKQTQNP